METGSIEHAQVALNEVLKRGLIAGWSFVNGTRTHASIKDDELRQRNDLPYAQWDVRIENYNLNAGEEWKHFYSTAEVIAWVQSLPHGDDS